jgi:hypothetical protein
MLSIYTYIIYIPARVISHLIELTSILMTCDYWQKNGYPALMWASKKGQADTVRLLVQHGAALDLVDEVNIHAHPLVSTCCIKAVSVLI